MNSPYPLLYQKFKELVRPFSSDLNQVNALWSAIEKHYTHSKRHYHNLQHLAALFNALDPVKSKLSDIQTISFAVFYHDIIYNV